MLGIQQRCRMSLPLRLIFCLAAFSWIVTWSRDSGAQTWDAHFHHGMEAMEERQWERAAEHLKAALAEAERVGPAASRLRVEHVAVP